VRLEWRAVRPPLGPADLALPDPEDPRGGVAVLRDTPERFVYSLDARRTVLRVAHLYSPSDDGRPPLWLPTGCEEVTSFLRPADLLWLTRHLSSFAVRVGRVGEGGRGEWLGTEVCFGPGELAVRHFAEQGRYELSLASLTAAFWPWPVCAEDVLKPEFYLMAVLERL
jgi:hypothetical protein